ncbi:hypothetical protein DPMN_131983 [Dreissena polymorpha]|uniref:Uncharacterized protein n=1 Tax=Dreissena polymorpha TaxID=45954 RepID=A0A9D4FVX4_DREPO|nr:hypothetical protein DPMN_131983 [Dreissena polymorpha]
MADIHLVRRRRPRQFKRIDRPETDLTDDEVRRRYRFFSDNIDRLTDTTEQGADRTDKALNVRQQLLLTLRAAVFAGYAPMEPVTPPALTGAIMAYAGRDTVTPRRSPGEWRWRPGRAPIYRDSAGIHRGSTWAPPAVALPGSLWAPPRLTHRGSTGIILSNTNLLHSRRSRQCS